MSDRARELFNSLGLALVLSQLPAKVSDREAMRDEIVRSLDDALTAEYRRGVEDERARCIVEATAAAKALVEGHLMSIDNHLESIGQKGLGTCDYHFAVAEVEDRIPAALSPQPLVADPSAAGADGLTAPPLQPSPNSPSGSGSEEAPRAAGILSALAALEADE